MRRTEQTLKEYIENRVERITESGCWIWMKALDDHGYGTFRNLGTNRNVKAHRAAYEEFIGGLSVHVNVLHRCDVPACCNPAHLFLGTQIENMADCSAKKRTRNQKKTHCASNHEFTPDNTVLSKRGLRRCKTCRKRWDAERYIRKKALCEKLNAL